MPGYDISEQTFSKVGHQLRAAKNDDPSGLIKEFLADTYNRMPEMKYDKDFHQSTGHVNTRN